MTKDFDIKEFLYSRFYAEANVQDRMNGRQSAKNFIQNFNEDILE